MKGYRHSKLVYKLPETQLGVSLIEIMIALTAGLLILAGIGYSYVGSRQNFRSQDALSRMQEGARMAFEIMESDIRMAGFTGCSLTLPALNPWYENLNRPLTGYENSNQTTIQIDTASNPAQDSTFNPTFTPAINGDVAVNAISGDVLTVLRADRTSTQVFTIKTHAGNTITPNTMPASPALIANQILLGADLNCNGLLLMQINTVSSSTFTYNTLTSIGTVTPLSLYSTVYPLSAVAYFIQRNGNNEPTLYRQRLQTDGSTLAEELIEGVQDMQLSYGIDADNVTDASGSKGVDCYVNANQIPLAATTGSCSTLNGTVDWSRVFAVRVNLMMVSRQSEGGITNQPQQYNYNIRGSDAIITRTGALTVNVVPTDNLLRKSFTATIAVRNR